MSTSISLAPHSSGDIEQGGLPDGLDRFLGSSPGAAGMGSRALIAFRVFEGDHVRGELRFHHARHPNGLGGTCIAVDAFTAGPPIWFPAALDAATPHLRSAFGAASLVGLPFADDPGAWEQLEAAGFVAVAGQPGLHIKELLPPTWRRGGVFIIAEAGSNWRMGTLERDLAMGRALIDVAAEAGADAVKFQTFRPETVYAEGAGASDYLAEVGIRRSILDIFADLTMPPEMIPELHAHARARGIGFMSTPFSPVDFALVDPYVEVHKIASYEISHIRLIELAAKSGKPTIMSTGAADVLAVAYAVEHFRRHGGGDLCLMQCTAKYPAPLSTLNLSVIPELVRSFGVPAGLSDHSREPLVAAIAATALGARAIEKHFTLDNRLPGPDHQFAVTPTELRALVEGVRAAEAARGSGIKEILPEEEELAAFARRGLQAIGDIQSGDVLREDVNVAILRPGKNPRGIHPRHIAMIEGRRATRGLRIGEGLRMGDWEE